jgi:hypothetical protein
MKKKEKKMKKYKVTISTSDAYDLEIEADSTQKLGLWLIIYLQMK